MTVREIFFALGFDVDRSSESKAESSINNLKNMASKALGAIGIAVSVSGVFNAIKDCVALSSEVEEMENKFNVVFDSMSDEVDAWAQNYADAIGRNKNDIKTYLADQQNLLVGFGMTRQEGAELSKQMTTLALDLASFANLDETAAVNAMTKAVMGESESAKTLGAVLNDTTRAQAMLTLGMTGTYDSLDQLSKMQVNYQAILSQSPDAIGDCERSLGSYQSTLKSFQSKLKELKTLIGQFFMPTFQKVLSFGAKGLTTLRNWVQRISEFADKVGGADKIITVLGATIAAVFAILNFSKITAGLSAIGKLLTHINVKTLAIIAVVLILVLLIQDFIAFLQGDNSVIGTLFDKAGIGAENARQTIIQAWNAIAGFLLGVWEMLKTAVADVTAALGEWWAENGDNVLQALSTAWQTIVTILTGLWNTLSDTAHAIFDALSQWWEQNGEGVMESLSEIWEQIQSNLSSLWEALSSAAMAIFEALQAFWDTWGATIMDLFNILWTTLAALIQPFLDALSALLDFVTNVFTGNWEGAWQSVQDIVSAASEMISTLLQGAWDAIQAIWEPLSSWFTDIFESAKGAIEGKVGEICSTIQQGFQTAINWITSLPSQAIQWGADIINGIVSGIQGAIGNIASAVSGVAQTIRSYLHFSVPDEGPLTDYESWMPDFMTGLAEGIQNSKHRVIDAIKSVAGGLSVAAQANLVSSDTVSKAGGGSAISKTINQVVNISNQFNGDRAGQEKSSKAMDKASSDATAEMARAIAFAR